MKNWIVLFVVWFGLVNVVCAEVMLVGPKAGMKFIAHQSAPGEAVDWTAPAFDDSAWSEGSYGVGYETNGNAPQIRTKVPVGTMSVYTRSTFEVTDLTKIKRLGLRTDYDDACAIWLNGKEVFRSRSLPKGKLGWKADIGRGREVAGRLGDRLDISKQALPALVKGQNVLAIGVWNVKATSSDLLMVPELMANAAAGSQPATSAEQGVVRGPYLQQGSPSQMIVRWRSGQPTDSVVHYGTAADQLTKKVVGEEQTTEHILTLSDLEPYTTYYYSVGDSGKVFAGGDAQHFFKTSPPMGPAHPTRIWVLGDSGTANEHAAAVRDAYVDLTGDAYTDLLIMLGDNAYNDGKDDQYQRAVFEMYPTVLRQTPVWPTLGNHDGHSADSMTQSGPYYDIFSLPTKGEVGGLPTGTEAYYSFDYANMHFICLESYETDRSKEGPMYAWLKNDLAATTQEWIIAFWHHPPYTKGSHNSDKEKNLVDMRKNFLPILEEYGVDLVLGGHSHCYERSHPTHGHYGTSDTVTDDMLSQKETNEYTKTLSGPDKGKGAFYAVAGASGKISGGSLDHPIMKVSLRELGSMVIEVDGRSMKARYLNSKGETRDEFTVEKK